MKRGIITMTDGGRVTMPQQEVWMTCDEIADMFLDEPSGKAERGLLYATVARAIRSIYKKGELREDETMQLSPYPSRKDWSFEVYNLDMILYLTYKVPSRNARIFRQYMTNKAYERNPYEHICIIVDDVDFRQNRVKE